MRRRRPNGPVESAGGGSILITLGDGERASLTSLFDQLDSLLASGPDDPRVRRLYPAAYHDDPEREAEYRAFMTEELATSRSLAIARAREALATEGPLDAGQAMSFLTVLNSLRLVLGTILDVDEGDEPEVDPSSPEHHQWELYGYLGWLLEWTIDAIGGD